MSTTHPRRLIRELPTSLQPATRLAEVGSKQLTITELIALVMGSADGLDLATEIVTKFTVSDLPQTTLTELQQLHGVGPSRAGQLLAAIELGRRLVNYREERPQTISPSAVADLLMPKLKHEEQEHLIVLLLSMKNHVLDTIWLYKGTLNSSVLRVAEVFREAIRRNAAAIIIAHNHPSGDPEPSLEDIRVTRDIREAGTLLDIDLLDHVIIGNGRFTSMKQRKLGF